MILFCAYLQEVVRRRMALPELGEHGGSLGEQALKLHTG